jgi:hypothetical protein
MDWKTISFGIFDGKRGSKEQPGIHTDGVDLRTARRQELYIEGHIAAADWPAVTRELAEYWLQIAAVYDRCLPAEPPLDTLVVEIEPEGGQLKSYLEDSTGKRTASPLVLNGIVRIMDEGYHALPAPDESEEDELAFEQGINSIRAAARQALVDSLRSPQASRAIWDGGGLATKHDLTVVLRDQDEGDEPLEPAS